LCTASQSRWFYIKSSFNGHRLKMDFQANKHCNLRLKNIIPHPNGPIGNFPLNFQTKQNIVNLYGKGPLTRKSRLNDKSVSTHWNTDYNWK
jgi:hypothetical protein